MALFPEEILNKINSADTILVATHVSPDPDAIGSSGALVYALNQLGKDVSLYLPEDVPERLNTFYPIDLVLNKVPQTPYLLIGLDCATKKRLGDEADLLLKNASSSINIDHHESNELWADINYIKSKEAATSSLVFELLNELSLPIDSYIASSLYAGIMDDTGSFRFSNTDEKVLITASKLISYGARPSDISNVIYFQESIRAIKLRGKAIDSLRITHDGKVAISHISIAMRGEESHVSGDSEGVIDMVRSVEGVKLAIFLREKDPGHWRGSIRSKSHSIDVSAFAERFGGGGHRAASGFSVLGTESEVISILDKELTNFLSNS